MPRALHHGNGHGRPRLPRQWQQSCHPRPAAQSGAESTHVLATKSMQRVAGGAGSREEGFAFQHTSYQGSCFGAGSTPNRTQVLHSRIRLSRLYAGRGKPINYSVFFRCSLKNTTPRYDRAKLGITSPRLCLGAWWVCWRVVVGSALATHARPAPVQATECVAGLNLALCTIQQNGFCCHCSSSWAAGSIASLEMPMSCGHSIGTRHLRLPANNDPCTL